MGYDAMLQYWKEEHQTITSILNSMLAFLEKKAKSRGYSKVNIILIQKHIHDSINENQRPHRINLGLIANMHVCSL